MRTKSTRSTGRNPAATAKQRAARARERREAAAVEECEFGERLREAEQRCRETGETGLYGAEETEEPEKVRGGLRGAQTRAFERVWPKPPLGTWWRMSRIFWLPLGETVLLCCHSVQEVHNGSRPALCARVSVYPLDQYVDPRRDMYRRLEVWISSPRLSALVAPYTAWTPLRIIRTGRGSWSVREVPKSSGLWLAAHLLEQQAGAPVGPVGAE